MPFLHRRAACALLFAALVAPAAALFAADAELPVEDPGREFREADSIDGRWNESDVGPFLASVLKLPGGDVAKGLSIKLGAKNDVSVAYDTKTCSFRAAWTGGFLKYDTARFGVMRAPVVDGTLQLAGPQAAWGNAPVRYRGLHQHDRRVVLAYEVDGVSVLEAPWAEGDAEHAVVMRTLEVGPRKGKLTLQLIASDDGRKFAVSPRSTDRKLEGGSLKFDYFEITTPTEKDNATSFLFQASDASCKVESDSNATRVALQFSPSETATRVSIVGFRAAQQRLDDAVGTLARSAVTEVRKLKQPNRSLWPDWIPTGGKLGKGTGPYVIDTVNVPFDNPYKALMFTSGLGFLSNGDIAVSTLHGDVWLVRGVDDDLSDVKWKRFATGLCQPLGLTVVDDKVLVLGKDQITRLHDTNGDDEADSYECFNNAGATSLGGHDYAACLDTDPEGNFYYIRAHEGVCRVSKDGKSHKSIATGFRNPIGLGVGPDGMVTAAPQEGEWTPASSLIAVKEGGYYGFAGPKKTDARPLGYDNPLCWMPRSQDNSSGGQVWVTSDRWGLPRGQMLHLSYGYCAALVVLHETIEDKHGAKVVQGGTVKLPLFFESGVCRGRFRESDGQLYLCGLNGWQTAAAKDGCLQRVRYTGKPVTVPIALQVKPNGIELTFSSPLDPKTAGNPDNYFLEQWNYQYAASYGSKEYKPSDPKKFGRDEVLVDDVKLSNDNRTVLLELEEVSPVMQMSITYQLKSAAGDDVKQTVYNTINAVPAK